MKTKRTKTTDDLMADFKRAMIRGGADTYLMPYDLARIEMALSSNRYFVTDVANIKVSAKGRVVSASIKACVPDANKTIKGELVLDSPNVNVSFWPKI